MFISHFKYIVLSCTSLFAIINSVAAIPAFLAMTAKEDTKTRKRLAKMACATCAGVLFTFALLGQLIFKIFNITMNAFEIAGGLVLLLVALDMLRARRSPFQESESDTRDASRKADIAITPLAIPMLSGPGAISTVVVLSGHAKGPIQEIMLYICILIASAASYGVFRVVSSGAARWLSPIAMNIIERLMGLLLAATAIQFMLNAFPSLR